MPIVLRKIPNRAGWAILGLASLVVAALLPSGTAWAQSPPPRVENGVIDLRTWDFARSGSVALDGQWAFYWRQFLTPEKNGDTMDAEPQSFLKVPYVWNDHPLGAERLPGFGYATYRMRILLSPEPEPLALHVIDVATACTVYANGRLVYRAGLPGTSREMSTPGFLPGVADLGPVAGEIDLVVHVANFHHRQGGLWDRITIGRPQQMHAMREGRIVFNMVLFGSLLLMGLYHLGIYGLRRDARSSLYFGLACLTVTLRTLTTGERYLVQLVPAFPFEWLSKLEYLGFYLAIGCFALFTRSLFPEESDRRILFGIATLAGLFSLLVLTTPLRIYSYSTPVFEGITVLALGYGMVILGRALRKERSGAEIFLAGFLVLAATAINDILYSRQVIHTFYMVQFGLLFFILSQSFLISRRFSELFDVVAAQRIKLKVSEEKYRQLVENANEAIFIVQDGTFKFANTRTETIFGFDARELSALPFMSSVYADDRPMVKKHLDRGVASGMGVATETFRLVKRSGRTVWVHLNAVPTTWEDRPAILNFLSDFSGRKQMENQLHRAQKMEALATLASGLAQDFNKFIANVLQNAERAMMNLPADSESRSFLQKVMDAGLSARKLVEQVLVFSRKGHRAKRPIRVALEIEEAVRMLRAAHAPNITIRTDIAASTAMMMANGAQIRDILLNLANNATDAMKEAGGILQIGLHEVTVTCGSCEYAGGLNQGNYVRLTVADNGRGIPEEIQDRIFEPYFTAKPAGEGTGMGLSVVMGIVKRHKGDIGLVSSLNTGTTFHVYLPTISLSNGAGMAE
ncbi:MAG: PAS domain S-box protein [Desulfobacterales bacterium]|nr:PAS domain S-box protein [Desulfobacterales bacterium]